MRTAREEVAAAYAAYDTDIYHMLDGEERARFRPASLTPASRLPPTSQLFKPDENDSIPKPPSQKALSSVFNHRKWVRLLDAAHEFDRTAVDTALDHREATRIVSASQFASGSWLEVPPDTLLP